MNSGRCASHFFGDSNGAVLERIYAKIVVEIEQKLMDEAKAIKNLYSNKLRMKLGKKSFIFNLGMGKCGSTTLQAKLLPLLPLQKYSYQGRYYKLIQDKSLTIKPFNVNGSVADLLATRNLLHLSEKISSLYEMHDCICYSNELLPVEFKTALDHANCIIKVLPKDVDVIYLFSVRNPRKALLSSYAHACLQYMSLNQLPYRLSDVIIDDTSKDSDYLHLSDDSTAIGTKRPLFLRHFWYSRIIRKFLSGCEKPGSIFISDVEILTSSRRFWFDLFHAITDIKNHESIFPFLDLWMEQIEFLSATNKKTEFINSIPIKYRFLNIEQEQRIIDLGIQCLSEYKELGSFYF